MENKLTVFQKVLKILGTLALIGYVIFLIGEGIPPLDEITFASISVYILFLIFLAGYYTLWKSELIAGILFIAWHGIQWLLVFYVWTDGELTLIFGLPIGIMGIVLLIYGWRKK